jgi:DnaJ-domain-containing protein 1
MIVPVDTIQMLKITGLMLQARMALMLPDREGKPDLELYREGFVELFVPDVLSKESYETKLSELAEELYRTCLSNSTSTDEAFDSLENKIKEILEEAIDRPEAFNAKYMPGSSKKRNDADEDFVSFKKNMEETFEEVINSLQDLKKKNIPDPSQKNDDTDEDHKTLETKIREIREAIDKPNAFNAKYIGGVSQNDDDHNEVINPLLPEKDYDTDTDSDSENERDTPEGNPLLGIEKKCVLNKLNKEEFNKLKLILRSASEPLLKNSSETEYAHQKFSREEYNSIKHELERRKLWILAISRTKNSSELMHCAYFSFLCLKELIMPSKADNTISQKIQFDEDMTERSPNKLQGFK